MTIFSKIIQKQIPAYTIAEDDFFYAFLDINPLTKGHCLVVPKVEIDKLFDLPDNYLGLYLLFCKRIATAIEKTVICNRVSIITVGLEVPHAHIHLIPFNRVEELNFSNKKLQLTKQEFEDIQQHIISHLE